MGDKKYDEEALQHIADLVAERIISQVKTANESIDQIKLQMTKIPAIHDDVAELVSDMRAVKRAIKETNEDLRELERRVNRLETAYSA